MVDGWGWFRYSDGSSVRIVQVLGWFECSDDLEIRIELRMSDHMIYVETISHKVFWLQDSLPYRCFHGAPSVCVNLISLTSKVTYCMELILYGSVSNGYYMGTSWNFSHLPFL